MSLQVRTPQPVLESELAKLNPSVRHEIAQIELENDSNRDAASAKLKRSNEFSAGRKCAQSVLNEYSCQAPVEVNDDRSPKWPKGFVGSITHSSHWTWAAVARDLAIASVGVDTEPVVDRNTRLQIQNEIATTSEWEIANTQQTLTPEQLFSVVFSAKEAFYKCWYPLRPLYFGFKDAAIESISSDRLRIRCTEKNPNFGNGPASLDVFFFANEQDVFTFTWMDQE